jgi:hypothetical protein
VEELKVARAQKGGNCLTATVFRSDGSENDDDDDGLNEVFDRYARK